MYVARLRSGGRKHYNVRSVLRGIFWNAHSVLCMSGAAGDGRTIHTYIYIYINNSRMCFSSMWGEPDLPDTSDMQGIIWVEPDLAVTMQS